MPSALWKCNPAPFRKPVRETTNVCNSTATYTERVEYAEYEILSEVRRSVASTLVTLGSAPLHEAYDALESIIPALVRRALAIQLRWVAFEQRTTYIDGAYGSIVIGGLPHDISVASHGTNPNLLVASVRATIPGSSPLVRKPARGRTERLGRYSHIHLSTSHRLLPAQDRLIAAAILAVQVAYEELMSWTLERFAGIRDDSATALYQCLREFLPDAFRHDVWLYAFASGQGFYVPDIEAREVVFERVRRRTVDTIRSPLALASDFMTHVLPFEKTFSRHAVQGGEPVRGIFAAAPYIDEGVGITESAVYKSEGLYTQPLASAGKALVVAGYSLEHRTHLEGPLREAGRALQPLLENTAAALHQQLSQIKDLSEGAKSTFGKKLVKHIGVRPVLLGLVELDLKALASELFGPRKSRK